MRGGVRKNAGRNKISVEEKKIAKSIHVSPLIYDKIKKFLLRDVKVSQVNVNF